MSDHKSFLPRATRLARGRKSQRGGGGSLKSIKAQPKLRHLILGFADHSLSVEDSRPRVTPRVLSDHASDLLAAFYRREAFWRAVVEMESPVEFAGSIHVLTRKRRSYEILDELQTIGGPFGWFRLKALVGMQEGRIGRGRETTQSSLADAFFMALAGGPEGFETLRASFGARHSIDIEEAIKDKELPDREAVDYMIYSQLLWRV